MGFITEKKVKGITYYYWVTSKRNKKSEGGNGKVTKTFRILGKTPDEYILYYLHTGDIKVDEFQRELLKKEYWGCKIEVFGENYIKERIDLIKESIRFCNEGFIRGDIDDSRLLYDALQISLSFLSEKIPENKRKKFIKDILTGYKLRYEEYLLLKEKIQESL